MVDPLSKNLTNDILMPPTTEVSNDIKTFFRDIETHSFKSSDESLEGEHDHGTVPVNVSPYSADYKPPISESKIYVYSINELLSFSKVPASPSIQELIDSLPKKKFWRFGRRFSDQGSHKGTGQKNGNRSPNPNSKTKSVVGEESFGEKKNSKGKNSRVQHPKRGSKFGKGERIGYLEEKDITVNNEDLLALEENFERTGNSMADFESWKAKMKEMERKKRGLSETKIEGVENKAFSSSTSSSISDFLKLNKNSNADNGGIEKVDASDRSSADEHRKNKQNETLKGASRFSSFFTQSSSPNVPTPAVNTAASATEQHPDGNAKKPLPATSGSRLMSFFNADSQKVKQAPGPLRNSSGPKEVINSFIQPTAQYPGPQPVPPLPNVQRVPAGEQSQTNNLFFQGLLNRGKLQESNGMPAPPPEMSVPPGMGHLSHAPVPQQSQQAHRGTVPPGFPMGISPANFPPPFQRSSQMPAHLVSENTKNIGDSKSMSAGGNSTIHMNQHRNHPPPGVLPQMAPGMAPPGFSPMQGLPPNFNPSMYGPPAGIMPPNGQPFYPPMPPPPGGNVNFGPFQIPSMPKQQDSRPSK